MAGHSGPTKVLLVDPDASRRFGLTLLLRELDCEVETASNLGERDPSAEPVDVAILAGPGLVDRCHACVDAGLATAILAVVAAGEVADVLEAGAADCLAHPVTRAALGVRLAAIASRRSGAGGTGGRVEAALRDSEDSLRSVLEASPEGVIVHRDGRHLYVNPAAVRLLGFADAEQARGTSIYDRVEPEDAEWVRERVEGMMATGEGARPRDLKFRRVDGEVFIGEAVSITASFSGVRAIITIVREVTEQRRIHSQMFLADRLATVGTLTVGVAHEINNPLAWVVGNLGLLADEFDNQVRMRELPAYDPDAVAASRARVRELLGRAQEGSERVRRIVRDLGRFGRADQGADEIVDLHALLDSAIEIADVQIRHRARLGRDYRARGLARGSEARLGQVFLNLLVNAGQAIAPGSSRDNAVRVSTRDLDDGRVEVAIFDTGSGIPEAIRRRIFEPFFTTKPSGEGTGIGLAISRDIVRSMGGEILVESELGAGTTFRVRVPGLPEAEAEAPAPAPTPTPTPSPVSTSSPASPGTSHRVRVLVIDDEPLIREMVCDALAKYEVTAVDNGRDALAKIQSEDWDLILCDVILPEISGLDIHARLRQERPELADKMVFMTGGDFSSSSSHGIRAPAGGVVRRLDKPFSIKALRALVAEVSA